MTDPEYNPEADTVAMYVRVPRHARAQLILLATAEDRPLSKVAGRALAVGLATLAANAKRGGKRSATPTAP